MESIEDNVTRQRVGSYFLNICNEKLMRATQQLLDLSGEMRTNWKEREAAAKAVAKDIPISSEPPTKIAPPISVRNVKFGKPGKKGPGKPDAVAQIFASDVAPLSSKPEDTTRKSGDVTKSLDIQKLLSTDLDDDEPKLTSPTKRRIISSDEDDDEYDDVSTETKKQKR
jgi:hypothetical protein